MNRQRLEGEALRDALLAAAGTLNLEMGGPPVRVPLEPEVYATIFTEGEPDNLWPVTPDARQHTRRSLYLLRKRNVRLPLLAVFDQPDMMTPCAARSTTVHALQALTLMNSAFMKAQSEALAGRVLGVRATPPLRAGNRRSGVQGSDSGPDGLPRTRTSTIEELYLLTLGRPPREVEVRATERFLADQTALLRAQAARGEAVVAPAGLAADLDPAEAGAWVDLCLAMLNLNEFVYVR
jgi:hypothetical protein